MFYYKQKVFITDGFYQGRKGKVMYESFLRAGVKTYMVRIWPFKHVHVLETDMKPR